MHRCLFAIVLGLSSHFLFARTVEWQEILGPEKHPLEIPATRTHFPEIRQQVTDAVQTGDGHIWVTALDGGVWRYDGYVWQCTGLSDLPMQSLIVHKGALLAAGDAGVYRFEESAWKRVFPQEEGTFPWTLSRLVKLEDGRVFCGGVWGLLELTDPARPTLYCPSHLVEGLQKRFPWLTLKKSPAVAGDQQPFPDQSGVVLATSLSLDVLSAIYAIHPDYRASELGINIGDVVTGIGDKMPRFQESFTRVQPPYQLTLADTLEAKARERSLPGISSPATCEWFQPTNFFIDKHYLWLEMMKSGVKRWDTRLPFSDPRAWTVFPGGNHFLGSGWSNQRLARDRSGVLWGTGGALHQFDQTNKTWTAVKLNRLYVPAYELFSLMNGDVWLVGSGTTALLNQTAHELSLTTFPKQTKEFAPGLVWIEENGNAILDARQTVIREFADLRYVGRNHDGYWFSGQGNTIVNATSDLKQFRLLLHKGEPVLCSAFLVHQDYGAVALISDEDKLKALVYYSGEWRELDSGLLLGNDEHIVVCEGADRSVWITRKTTSANPGSWRIIHFKEAASTQKQWDIIDYKQLKSLCPLAEVMTASPDGALWIGGARICTWQDQHFSPPVKNLNGVKDFLIAEGGKLWVAGKLGISIMDRDIRLPAFAGSKDKLPAAHFLDLEKGPRGGVLAVCEGGIFWHDGTDWHSWGTHLTKGLVLTDVKLEGDHTLWINHTHGALRVELQDTLPRIKIAPAPRVIEAGTSILFQWQGTDYLNQTPTEKLEYSWRVNEEPWSAFQKMTSAQFTNLEPGSYTFQLRCRNSNFLHKSQTGQATFTVLAPLHRRPWFIAMCAGLILSLAGIVLLLIRRVKERTLHELELERLKSEQIRATGELKLSFFTNISHELRTPLTLILGPLEKLCSEQPDNDRLGIIRIGVKLRYKPLVIIFFGLLFFILKVRCFSCIFSFLRYVSFT